MRSLLALGLLITLSASASAATPHHFEPRHIVMSHGPVYAGPGWAYAPRRAPDRFDDTPSYNDPSKFGGGTAL